MVFILGDETIQHKYSTSRECELRREREISITVFSVCIVRTCGELATDEWDFWMHVLSDLRSQASGLAVS